MPARALLQADSGPVNGPTFEVGSGGATFGGARENAIHIPDQRLSRQHARTELRDGAWMLADLGSTNGTFVNGARLNAPHSLHPGDVIELGATRLTVTR